MRISGGKAKGRRTAPQRILKISGAGERLRPTSAKVREAVFDILRNRIDGAIFVDLYAGTGTMGLEALSRGANKSVFVEPDDLRFRTIKKSAYDFGFQDRAHIIKGRANEFINKRNAGKEKFDIIFIDPPYQSDETDTILPLIGQQDILSEGGTVIVEHFFKRKMPEKAGTLIYLKNYRYGDTVLTFYGKAEP
jgi:16S rRNA (guanine966-N2)-methyltransferase